MNKSLRASRSHLFAKESLPVLYRCLLDEQAIQLLPRPAQAELRKSKWRGDLFLNPYCFLDSVEVRSLPFLTDFSSPDEMIWILDPDRNALQPFWLPEQLRSRLAHLQPGASAAAHLPPQLAKLLYFAGIVTTEKDCQARSKELKRSVARAADFFGKNRHVYSEKSPASTAYCCLATLHSRLNRGWHAGEGKGWL